MKKQIIIMIVLAVVVGAAAFYGGMTYGKPTAPSAPNGAGFNRQMTGADGNLRADGNLSGRGASGQILSADGKTMTISVRGGGSKIILLSDTTKISKMADGTTTDLTTGASVVVSGTTNQDGSISAANIQILPAGEPAGIPARNGNAPPRNATPQQ